jgi:hypothetical protein
MTAPAPAAPKPSAANRRTVLGLARALLPLLAIVLVVAWLRQPGGSEVPTVDPGPDLAYAARIAPYDLLAPTGLPAGWRATSSKVDAPQGEGRTPVTLTVGYLTPAGKYAGLTETDRRTADVQGADLAGATAAGSTRAGGRTWQRYRTTRGETALLLVADRLTLLITGSAPDEDLAALAGSLR